MARDREFTDDARLVPDLAHGADLFQSCAACHGTDGRGTGDGEVSAIAGQHGSVLLKQLTDFRHDQRWNERMQYFTAICLRQQQETAAYNRPGMDRAHVEILRGISPEALSGVADYLSRVSPDLSSIEGR